MHLAVLWLSVHRYRRNIKKSERKKNCKSTFFARFEQYLIFEVPVPKQFSMGKTNVISNL